MIPWYVYVGSFAITSPFLRGALLPRYQRAKYTDKTIILTGPLGALGKQLAYELAHKQCRLILACRDMERCKVFRREMVLKSKNKKIACRYLDLEDIDSIDKFANQIIKEEPRLDVLINNAAIKGTTEKQLTKYGIEKMYFVNFLAPFILTFRLHNKLLESGKLTGDSRVINNVGHIKNSWKINYDDINFEKTKWTSDRAYHQSKLALAYFTILLEKSSKEKYQDLYVYATSPCGKNIFHSTDVPFNILNTFMILYHSYTKMDSSGCVQSMIMCSIDPQMNTRSKSGRYYTWFLSSWGWPKICKKDKDSKLVWNQAVDLMNNLFEQKKAS